MGRIWRLTAVAAGAALLGLAASALVGAHLGNTISVEEAVAIPEPAPTSSLDRSAQPPSCASPPCTEAGSLRPRDELRLTPETEVAAGDAAPEAAPQPTPDRQRRGRGGRRRSSRAAVDDTLLPELSRGITKLGKHRYAIKQSALKRALGNLRWLSKAARVAPEVRDGKASGFRLVWVMAGGPIAKLGLRTGDVLVAVNGLDITTPDRALDAYGKLKAARRLVLGLERAGRRSTLEYLVR